MAKMETTIKVNDAVLETVKIEFKSRIKHVNASRRILGHLRDDLVRCENMDRKAVIMMLDIVISNLKRAVRGEGEDKQKGKQNGKQKAE